MFVFKFFAFTKGEKADGKDDKILLPYYICILT